MYRIQHTLVNNLPRIPTVFATRENASDFLMIFAHGLDIPGVLSYGDDYIHVSRAGRIVFVAEVQELLHVS